MIEYFKDKKRVTTPPYAVFQADEEDTVVTLYESGKVLFQGISADVDAALWREMDKQSNVKDYYWSSSIGSDEVGTGDYFGPIVVTAAYVRIKDIEFLENFRIGDSKNFTDSQIIKLVPKFIRKIKHTTIIINNIDYNKFYGADCNLNKIKAIGHNRVLFNLKNKIKKYDYIIVDQFTSPKSYYKFLNDTTNLVKDITFLTKAEDRHLSVACASLISRYHFIREMNKLSKKVGIKLPYGAKEITISTGKEIVNKYGENYLKNIAKLNFKNTDKILKD